MEVALKCDGARLELQVVPGQLLWGCTVNRVTEPFWIKTTSSLSSNADTFLALIPTTALQTLVSTTEQTIRCAAGVNASGLYAELPPKALSRVTEG